MLHNNISVINNYQVTSIKFSQRVIKDQDHSHMTRIKTHLDSQVTRINLSSQVTWIN